MKLKLIRTTFTDTSTIGELYIDGKFECFTLEDNDKGLTDSMPLSEIQAAKTFGTTCIPYGTYRVHITFSNRFRKLMPLLEGVRGFEGIRIHSGNTPEDTEGCIIVGTQKANNLVLHSRNAFTNLFNKISEVEDLTIEIVK